MSVLHILYDGFSQNPFIFCAFVFIVGSLIGSFLNVVIYRVPVMMERDFREQCYDYITEYHADSIDKKHIEPISRDNFPKKFNLVTPVSTCPSCGHKIKPWENIPVISYLLMRGKCTSCKTHISLQYPFVETITGLLSAVVAWQLGVSWECLAGLVLTWTLIALTGIDIKKLWLPDELTLPLMWLGLLISTQTLFVDTSTAIWGAVLGYLSLWSVYHLFKLLTGKEGMGYGDFKLLAALGAWMGASSLPLVIILSSVVGSILGLGMIIIQGRDKAKPLPFGPYLAIAGWIAFLWGDRIIEAYLGSVLS